MSSPSSLLTVRANSGYVQALSIARLGTGLAAFVAPTVFVNKLYGFNPNRSRSSATATTTVPQAGSAEELTLAVRLFGARDIALGLLLRDASSAVVERALQVGLIASALDLLAVAGGFFLEGTLSREVSTAVGATSAAFAAFQYFVLSS